MPKNVIVISLGGSLVVPDAIDSKFLRRFRQLIVAFVKRGRQCIIIVGGGMTARQYQRAIRQVVQPSHDDLDWIGIHATRLNAHLLRTIFRAYAYPRLITNMNKINTRIKNRIIVAAGFRPGASTDLRAVQLAHAYSTDTILNLSNIDWVYTRDPRKYRDAKILKTVSWKNFRQLFGSRWDPGANVPFDPVASRWAERWGMKVIITRGTDIRNLRKIFNGEKAKGTVIT